jgi:hypothetical protein
MTTGQLATKTACTIPTKTAGPNANQRAGNSASTSATLTADTTAAKIAARSAVKTANKTAAAPVSKASAIPSVRPAAPPPKPKGLSAARKRSDPRRDTAPRRAKKRERLVPKAAIKAPRIETPCEKNLRDAEEFKQLARERHVDWHRAGRTENRYEPRTGKPLGPMRTGMTKSVKGRRTKVSRHKSLRD